MNNLKKIEQKISSLPPGLMYDLELYLDFLLQKFKSTTHSKLKPKLKGTEKEFLKLFGCWRSEQTGDELTQEIYKARKDKPRDIVL